MQITMLKSKIHRATVTETNRDYEGSVAIDADLMKEVELLPYERVEIYNITNGERFATYAIEAEGGSGRISIQGAAAHKAETGDLVIICSYAQMTMEEAREFKPKRIVVDGRNRYKHLA